MKTVRSKLFTLTLTIIGALALGGCSEFRSTLTNLVDTKTQYAETTKEWNVGKTAYSKLTLEPYEKEIADKAIAGVDKLLIVVNTLFSGELDAEETSKLLIKTLPTMDEVEVDVARMTSLFNAKEQTEELKTIGEAVASLGELKEGFGKIVGGDENMEKAVSSISTITSIIDLVKGG